MATDQGAGGGTLGAVQGAPSILRKAKQSATYSPGGRRGHPFTKSFSTRAYAEGSARPLGGIWVLPCPCLPLISRETEKSQVFCGFHGDPSPPLSCPLTHPRSL